MFAIFESLGGMELLMVGIGALLLFGKDLPKVAAEAGAQFTKLKRSLDSTWRDSGLEREVRQIRDAMPRDLSLTDVARTASEKLAVRLEEEGRTRASNPDATGPVARGSTIQDPLPEPIEHATVPGIDPASEFRGPEARPVESSAKDPDADGPPRPPPAQA
ncbi:MAG: hypothetical protein NTY35_06470 [Planctomycetota bacterium]|nr:hypothetical protein [Planctomycetota bacterium]